MLPLLFSISHVLHLRTHPNEFYFCTARPVLKESVCVRLRVREEARLTGALLRTGSGGPCIRGSLALSPSGTQHKRPWIRASSRATGRGPLESTCTHNERYIWLDIVDVALPEEAAGGAKGQAESLLCNGVQEGSQSYRKRLAIEGSTFLPRTLVFLARDLPAY